MATFHINWSLTGTKTIEAESREEAERIFEQFTVAELAETGALDSYVDEPFDFSEALKKTIAIRGKTDDAA